MLAIEIDFLTGSIVAGLEADDRVADFPPQPDRVFSALVASWAARGRNAEERGALEWLESQDPPLILASAPSDPMGRQAPIVYVPPNDGKTSTDGSFSVIPARRQKQPRRFPAAFLKDSVVRIVWPVQADDCTRANLDALARDTSYVGHSTSLTRCRFVDDHFDTSQGISPKRVLYAGRMQDLVRWFELGQRPDPGHENVAAPHIGGGSRADLPRSIFSDEWIVLADDGGVAPSLLASPIVCRRIRDALMGRFERVLGYIPEWVSGHSSDGRPSLSPHLAVVPLADVGWTHSEGRLMGCAVIVPRDGPQGCSVRELWSVVEALLERPAGADDDDDSRITLHWGAGEPWYLMPQQTPQMASLRASRWLGRNLNGTVRSSKLWTTATPLALDRHPKGKRAEEREREIAETIRAACEGIGLPRPSFVFSHVSSSLRGAPPANVPRGAVPWQRWQVPSSLQGRFLTHATIGFDDPVCGPVIIGAGRFAGLGLCVSLDDRA